MVTADDCSLPSNPAGGSVMGPTRVLFVREGTWGDVDQEEHDEYLDPLIERLQGKTRKDPQTGKDVPLAEVIVVGTFEEALDKVKTYPFPDMVVFNSRGMEFAARELRKRCPKLRIVVLSGLIPDNEIVWVSKAWLYGDMLQDLFAGAW